MKIVIVGVAILLYAVFFLLLYGQYKEILILKKMIEVREGLIESQGELIAIQEEEIRQLKGEEECC